MTKPIEWKTKPIPPSTRYGYPDDDDQGETMRQEDVTTSDSLPGKATPTPWEAQSFGEGEDGIGIVGLRTNDGVPYSSPTNGLVAWATLLPTEIDANDPARAQANAALIVEAVNSHASLKSRIEELEAGLRQCRDHIRLNHKATAWHNDPIAYAIITKVIDPALNSQVKP